VTVTVTVTVVRRRSGNAQVTDPTMIFFPANMQLFENPSSRQYLRMYTQMAGFNVLLFNYRGVSESGGTLTQGGTVLDGEVPLWPRPPPRLSNSVVWRRCLSM
jgi:hypothetical protein